MSPRALVLLATLAWSACAPAAPSAPRTADSTEATQASLLRSQAPPTFANDIAPLVHRSCLPCHREGGSGPFVLKSANDVTRRGKLIREVVASRYMPPWKPVRGYGRFRGERALTEAELATFASWFEAGMPLGNMDDLAPAEELPDGWLLGEPDVVLSMTQEHVVPSEGVEQWRCFPIPTDLGARLLRSIEVRPSNPRVVHHVMVFTDATGATSAKPGAAAGIDGMCTTHASVDDLLSGWVPGMLPAALPEGLGLPLSAGADVLIDAHFQITGREERERMRLGLRFASDEAEASVFLMRLGQHAGLVLPPGARNAIQEYELVLPIPVRVLSILPHAHYVCQDVRVRALLPDGSEVPLVWIDDWDFGWQDLYHYEEPVPLPAGTTIRATFRYDNSAANPRNPFSPPRRILGGSLSTDEMASVFLQLVLEDEAGRGQLVEAMDEHLAGDPEDRVLEGWWDYLRTAYDTDGDLSLNAEEDALATAFLDGLWDARETYLTTLDTDGDGTLGASELARIRTAWQRWSEGYTKRL